MSDAPDLTPSEFSLPGLGSEVSDSILRSAVITGLALLIPVPFLDDYIALQARKALVVDLFRRRGVALDTKRAAVLYGGESKGCLRGCLGLAFGLLLKPIKKLFKTLFFVLGLRDMGLAITETMSLGRAVERCLDDGRLSGELTGEALESRCKRLRVAFEAGLEGTDRRALEHALTSSMQQAKTLLPIAASAARRLFDKDGPKDDGPAAIEGLPRAERDAVTQEVAAAGAVLEGDKARGFMLAFDERFDAAYAAASDEG